MATDISEEDYIFVDLPDLVSQGSQQKPQRRDFDEVFKEAEARLRQEEHMKIDEKIDEKLGDDTEKTKANAPTGAVKKKEPDSFHSTKIDNILLLYQASFLTPNKNK